MTPEALRISILYIIYAYSSVFCKHIKLRAIYAFIQFLSFYFTVSVGINLIAMITQFENVDHVIIEDVEDLGVFVVGNGAEQGPCVVDGDILDVADVSAKVFDKFDSDLLLLPELDMSVAARSYDELRLGHRNKRDLKMYIYFNLTCNLQPAPKDCSKCGYQQKGSDILIRNLLIN
jgi:hypothetical protein